MSRASIFVTTGLIFGVAFGSAFAGVLSAARLPEHDAQVAQIAAAAALAQAAEAQAAAAAAALQSPGTTPGGSPGPATATTIPAISASALSQALVLDARLTDMSTVFAAAMAAPTFDVVAASQLLRNASADAVIGLQLAHDVATWPGGAAVGASLSAFYETVQSTAAEGLAASMHNDAAYRRSATAMIKQLRRLVAIDDQARVLAASAGIIAPPAEASPAS